MTQDEIIEMARQAGWPDWEIVGMKGELKAFAKLVEERATEEANARANASWTLMCKKMVEEEREVCALICDDLYRAWTLTDEDDLNPPDALDCKRAIRARGES